MVVNSTWSEGFMSMIMVGAMNVGRIIVNEGSSYEKGDELGYFNLGSTIVMIIEAKDIDKWQIK